MSGPLPDLVRDVLDAGDFCHVAAMTGAGPHVTPMVFAPLGDSVWVTTSRGSVKARCWGEDARVAGLVRSGSSAVAFTGRVITYDLLEPESWARSLIGAPAIALAASRFTRKNARFFAGYAVDAHRVPLAWTPPGRVFAELVIERSALIVDDRVTGTWGKAWDDRLGSGSAFRASRTGEPLAGLPADLDDELGTAGNAALGIQTRLGPVVLPGRWTRDGAVYVALPEAVLALAGVGASAPMALQVDRPSWWRAREMVGAMVRGNGRVTVLDRLESGRSSASRIVERAGVSAEGAALVRVRPRSITWWRGWTSRTVAA